MKTGNGRQDLWSAEELALLASEYVAGDLDNLSERLGRTKRAIRQKARTVGLNRSRTLTMAAGAAYVKGVRGSVVVHGRPLNDRTYRSWKAMRDRCYCKSASKFENYGGRGIVVCERWSDFRLFLHDMGERPPGTSLDRYPNRNGNYEPGNCRWATETEQQRNRDDVRLLTVRGVSKPRSEWAAQYGINLGTLIHRVDVLGWDHERALGEPVKRRGQRAKAKPEISTKPEASQGLCADPYIAQLLSCI